MGSAAEFHTIFAALPGAEAGVPFAQFMELALYHPELGYYRRDRRRVGLSPEADFYTASSLGPVFGELVSAAAVRLLGADPGAFTFVELGAEPGGGVLAGVAHPFGSSQVVRLGDDLALPDRCVVFSNELFDAQPAHAVVRRESGWRELGVAWRDGQLVPVDLPELSPEVTAIVPQLPVAAPVGYRLDLPLRSVALLRQIVAGGWKGLFLAFDYGRTWRELAEEMPQGSLRAYRQHQQVPDLLAEPGRQDLTCHVCWDWLEAGLAASGFRSPVVESQEAFFARRAGEAVARMIAAEAAGFSPRKQALLQLLHPAQMGQKFQVLHALRV